MSDAATRARHRAAWQARPELRLVYREWFDRLLEAAGARRPVVEVGSGPGFFKAAAPALIATDVMPDPALDVQCDAGALPFRASSLGAIVMVDALHHLPRPLDFLAEAARALRPGGRLAMVEPWITLPSWVLYRFLHHEKCRLRVDPAHPFAAGAKGALEGNAAIPYLVLGRLRDAGLPFHLLRAEPFVGLPYLATFGFKVGRALPGLLQRAARGGERLAAPLTRWLATRIFVVLEKPA
ncbi:MAG TPA: class I SAM-dependent methyltransferase [Candidatus Bathyarchaeia archaeon]|nr:class I SAM-dependent methyltransferase [Candidatus Bathyarchaeia archaeon]